MKTIIGILLACLIVVAMSYEYGKWKSKARADFRVKWDRAMEIIRLRNGCEQLKDIEAQRKCIREIYFRYSIAQ